jgi:hypothetical protein
MARTHPPEVGARDGSGSILNGSFGSVKNKTEQYKRQEIIYLIRRILSERPVGSESATTGQNFMR